MIGYVKAEINENSKRVDVDINAPSQCVAMGLAAAVASETIDNKADFNQFVKMLKNAIKANRKRDLNDSNN